MSKPHTVSEPLTVEAVRERATEVSNPTHYRLAFSGGQHDEEGRLRDCVALYREVLNTYAADRTEAGDLARAALGAER